MSIRTSFSFGAYEWEASLFFFLAFFSFDCVLAICARIFSCIVPLARNRLSVIPFEDYAPFCSSAVLTMVFFDSPFRTTRLCTGMQWFVLSPSPSLFLPKWLSLHSHLTKILSYMYVLISDGKLVQITLKSIINRITGVLGTPC
jgi:hypothetical protein